MSLRFGKKRRFGMRHKPASGELSLNITAMADIFMLILVFLLKGYTSGALGVSPSADVKLPAAFASKEHLEALKVEISKTAVQIEGKAAASLAEFKFAAGDVVENGVSKSLDGVFKVERQRQMLIAKANEDVKPDARLIVMADKGTPYSTIKSVLASAAVNGYTDFKLAVIDSSQ